MQFKIRINSTLPRSIIKAPKSSVGCPLSRATTHRLAIKEYRTSRQRQLNPRATRDKLRVEMFSSYKELRQLRTSHMALI